MPTGREIVAETNRVVREAKRTGMRTKPAPRKAKPKAAVTPPSSPSAARRVLSPDALTLSAVRPLRSVEVAGLGPDNSSGVVFYRPLSNRTLLRISEMTPTTPYAEQVRILVDYLAEVWVSPAGEPYSREAILAMDPAVTSAIAMALLGAKDLEVADHEALLADLGVPADAHAPSGDPLDALLSPNASGGVPSSAKSTA